MKINDPAVLADVRLLFQCYERALVENDVETLDALFWDNAATVRYGVGEMLYGMEEIRAFRAARPATGLARTVTRTQITVFGDHSATTHIEFTRDGVSRIGRQTQTWIRFPDAGWKVVSAHVSLMGG